jgi:uncharacterized small protein (DUF1192 family)
MTGPADPLHVARAALATIAATIEARDEPDPARVPSDVLLLLAVQRELTRAVAALTDELAALRAAAALPTAPDDADAGRNSVRIDQDTPVGGRGYDRGRPRRGYQSDE